LVYVPNANMTSRLAAKLENRSTRNKKL